jgi:hypothetical protein
MAAEKGSAFLLKIGNGASPLVYATVAGMRTTQLSVNGRGGERDQQGFGWLARVAVGRGGEVGVGGGERIFTGRRPRGGSRAMRWPARSTTMSSASRAASGCAGGSW